MIGRSSRSAAAAGVGEQPIGPRPVAGSVATQQHGGPLLLRPGPATPGARSAPATSTAVAKWRSASSKRSRVVAARASGASDRALGADARPDELRGERLQHAAGGTPRPRGRRRSRRPPRSCTSSSARGVAAVAGEALGDIAAELVELVEAAELGQRQAEGRSERADPRARLPGSLQHLDHLVELARHRGGPGTGSRRGRCGRGPPRRPRRRARPPPSRSPRPRPGRRGGRSAVAVMKPANIRRNGCPVRSASAGHVVGGGVVAGPVRRPRRLTTSSAWAAQNCWTGSPSRAASRTSSSTLGTTFGEAIGQPDQVVPGLQGEGERRVVAGGACQGDRLRGAAPPARRSRRRSSARRPGPPAAATAARRPRRRARPARPCSNAIRVLSIPALALQMPLKPASGRLAPRGGRRRPPRRARRPPAASPGARRAQRGARRCRARRGSRPGRACVAPGEASSRRSAASYQRTASSGASWASA